MMQVNALTGEVTIDLAGKTFRLRATMAKMADYQAALGVVGLGAIQRLIGCADARAVYQGLKCLCSSGNADDVDDVLLTPHINDASEAIVAALTAGLPDAKGKKAEATKAK